MSNSLTRKFCESRYRWPIVATATVLAALATVLPQTDEYFDNRSDRSGLSEELVRAQRAAAALPAYEKRMAAVSQELDALQRRTVDEGSLARYRSRLVDVIRESGCQIRQLDVGAPTARPWTQQDNPLVGAGEGKGPSTPFVLERRSVVIAVDGAMPAIHDLLARLEQERTIWHPRRVQMQAAQTSGETVLMELELWLFALARTPS
ncbi:MAG TPA: hypothetical protein VEQ85_04490 [Lacipirellulaceae bacterium]|nr:hypothetical protein [Lacipirellulaceae bacterium]